MAIKIPCGKIYGTPQHKLPKTFIDKVEYKNNDLQYSIDYLTLVETKSHDLVKDNSWKTNTNNQNDRNVYETDYDIGMMAIGYLKTYYATISFNINEYKNNKLYQVLNLYRGTYTDKNTNEVTNRIKHSVTYKQTNGIVSNVENTQRYYYPSNIDGFNITYEDKYETKQDKIEPIYKYTEPNKTFGVTISYTNKENFSTANYEPSTDGYKITLTILVGVEVVGMAGGYAPDDSITYPYGIECYKKEPLSVEVSFYGDVEEYEKVEIPLTFGDGNNVFATESNELLQSETKIGDKTANEIKSQSIIEAYKDGKETLEIKCAIGEYYDESNNLMISTKDSSKPMTFKIGDITIPYKYTVQGEQPLSLNKDKTPKEFVVTGIFPFFDGATWQKLILQEI